MLEKSKKHSIATDLPFMLHFTLPEGPIVFISK